MANAHLFCLFDTKIKVFVKEMTSSDRRPPSCRRIHRCAWVYESVIDVNELWAWYCQSAIDVNRFVDGACVKPLQKNKVRQRGRCYLQRTPHESVFDE